MKSLLILVLLLTSSVALAREHSEKWYQSKYCKGVKEYTLPDRTRIDCLTDTYAIEYDFADKWAEAIGQSLYYAASSDKLPGIVIILEDPTNYRYLRRLYETLVFYNLHIKIWIVSP